MILGHNSGYEPGGKEYIKYFFIVIMMISLVIVYVWQNIEVMKMQMDYKHAVKLQKKLIKENDSLMYEIEKYRSFERIEIFSEENGLKELEYNDIIIVEKAE